MPDVCRRTGDGGFAEVPFRTLGVTVPDVCCRTGHSGFARVSFRTSAVEPVTSADVSSRIEEARVEKLHYVAKWL